MHIFALPPTTAVDPADITLNVNLVYLLTSFLDYQTLRISNLTQDIVGFLEANQSIYFFRSAIRTLIIDGSCFCDEVAHAIAATTMTTKPTEVKIVNSRGILPHHLEHIGEKNHPSQLGRDGEWRINLIR
jgi:hypothetical protein